MQALKHNEPFTTQGLLLLIAVIVLSSRASGAVIINEIRNDQAGLDNDEYVEFFVSSPPESLNDLTFIVIGDDYPSSGNIEHVTPLGSLTATSPYFLMAQSSFSLGPTVDHVTDLNFENSDNVTFLLVSGFTGNLNDDLDTNDDGTLESTPWSSVVDGLSFLEDPIFGDKLYADALGLPTVGPDGNFVPSHAYRDRNGTWQVGPFAIQLDTPGAPNVPEPSVATLFGFGMAVLFLGRSRAPRR